MFGALFILNLRHFGPGQQHNDTQTTQSFYLLMGGINNNNYPEGEACYQAGMKWEANDDSNQIDTTSGAEDAVLNLVELEQLHEESERMKGLGNKHMAAQVSI